MKRVVVVVSCALAALAASSCREPTTVDVEARTNVAYRNGMVVSFTVGAPAETEVLAPTTQAVDPWGFDGFVGSLTVIPGSSEDARLGVKIVLGVGRDARECSPPTYDGCIIARRSLRYTPHERLRLPVNLYARCQGVPCTATSTCNYLGQCVAAEIEPASCGDPAGCTPPGDRPPGDVSALDGGGEDAGAHDAREEAVSDASIKDASDAAETGTDAGGTPGSVDCPPGKCTGGQKCCYGTSNFTGVCLNPSLPCSGTVMYPYTIECDGPEDCGGATPACCDLPGNRLGCAAAGCGGGAVVCHSTGGSICKSFQSCSPLFGTYYRECTP